MSITNVLADSRVTISALHVRLNRSAIKKASQKYGVPADIIGSIIYKEQFTQSIPDFVANVDTLIKGSSHSTGLGAIFPDVAIKSWNYINNIGEFSVSNIPSDAKSMQKKLTNDNEFNINTIATVLIYKAYGLNMISKPSDVHKLTEGQWRKIVGAYNANSPAKQNNYSSKVFEYRDDIKELIY